MIRPDPIIGTWKLNVSKSRTLRDLPIDVGQNAKEATEVYQEVDDQIELTLTGTSISGEPISGKVRWPRDGGIAGSVQEVTSYEGILIVETLIAPGDWYVTYLKDGKQVVVIHKIISEDGRTMSLISKQADTQDKPCEQRVVYDRQ
jgi:hypothetical protein